MCLSDVSSAIADKWPLDNMSQVGPVLRLNKAVYSEVHLYAITGSKTLCLDGIQSRDRCTYTARDILTVVMLYRGRCMYETILNI